MEKIILILMIVISSCSTKYEEMQKSEVRIVTIFKEDTITVYHTSPLKLDEYGDLYFYQSGNGKSRVATDLQYFEIIK